MVLAITMKPPISSPTTNKTTNKKDHPNPITKYFVQNIPTPTKQYSRTQKLINKIKNATTKTKRIIKIASKPPQNYNLIPYHKAHSFLDLPTSPYNTTFPLNPHLIIAR